MDDQERRARQEQAIALLAARVNRDPDAYELLAVDMFGGEDVDTPVTPALEEVFARLIGMTELAAFLLVQLEGYSDLAENPADLLKVLALYLATEQVD